MTDLTNLSWQERQERDQGEHKVISVISVISVIPRLRMEIRESREIRTKLYEGRMTIRVWRISYYLLLFILNFMFVSSIQNLTAINHNSSILTTLHTSNTIEATSLPAFYLFTLEPRVTC